MRLHLRGDGELLRENAQLRSRLDDVEDTLRAIGAGDLDAVVLGGKIYSIQGAETRYRLLIEAMGQGAAMLMTDGTVLYANRSLAEMLMIPLSELIGSSLRQFVAPADLPSFDAWLIEGQHRTVKGELDLQNRYGRPIPAHLSLTLLDTPGSHALSVVATDLTGRNLAEEALRRSNRALWMISACDHSLVHAATEADLLKEICQAIVTEGGYRSAWVGYAEHDEAKTIRPVARAGHDEGYYDNMRITWADSEQGRRPAAQAIRTGQVSISQNFAIDPNFAPWRPQAIVHGFASGIALPLWLEGSVWGALCIYAGNTNAFNDEETKLLVTLADDLSYGIEVLHIRAEHQVAEATLRAAEERFRIAAETSNDVVYEWDLKQSIQWFGKIDELLGYAADEFPRTFDSCIEMLHPDDRDRVLAAVRANLDGQSSYVIECRIRAKDGTYRWWSARAAVSRDAAGAPCRWIGTVTDITERKQAEIQIRSALTEAQRFREALDHVSAFVYMKDAQARYVYANRPTLELFGCSAEELVGRNDEGFFPPEVVEQIREVDSRVFRGEHTAEEINVPDHKRGRRVYWEVKTPIQIEVGGQTTRGLLGISTDITERKRTEEALRESEERFQLAVRGSAAAIWDWNILSGECYYSPRFLEMLGYGEAEFPPRVETFYAHIHPDDVQRVQEAVEAHCSAARRPHNVEFRMRMKDGGYRWFRATGQAIFDQTGRAYRMLGSTFDIMEQKQAEEQIRKLNQELEQRVRDRTVELEAANTELEAFVYTVSHDLRAPLRSIDGFSRLLIDGYGDKLDEEGRDYLRRVRASSQHMGHLIDDILRLSRLTRGELRRQPVDLSALALALLAELQRQDPERQVEVVVEPDIVVSADPTLMRSVLENLLGNAWKFTSKKAVAKIEFGRAVRDGVPTFYVRDNGVGFNIAYAGKLFGVFQRLHSSADFPGTGVGLASVQRIVHRHRGQVWAESQVGKGSTFYFNLEPAEVP